MCESGIYERGNKLLLQRGFDRFRCCFVYTGQLVCCLFKIHALMLLGVKNKRKVVDRCYMAMCDTVYILSLTNACEGVCAIVLISGCCMLSKQGWPQLHNPSAHFSSSCLPSSWPLFLLCLTPMIGSCLCMFLTEYMQTYANTNVSTTSHS